MADKSIAELPEASQLLDDGMTVVYQGNQTNKIAGSALKTYARTAVQPQVDEAEDAAEAAQAAQTAAEAAQTAAEKARTAAQSAQTAAETAEDNAATHEANASGYAQNAYSAQTAAESARAAAETARTGAETAQTGAETAKQGAQDAQTAAETAKADAEAAQEAAETAQDAAETAKADAQGYSETAAEKATDAYNSAETAKQYSGNPAKPVNGTWWIWDADSQAYVDSHIPSVITVVKNYPSIAAMDADFSNMQENDMVIIATADISDPDNSKLYIRGETDWIYLSDLSGLPGVGIASIEKTAGTGAPGTVDTYTITLTDGSTTQFTVYNGEDGQGTGDMTAAVYDTQGKNTDIFIYTDGKRPVPFTVTLTAAGWSGNAQTVSDARFIPDGYAYIVSPDEGSYEDWANAMVRAGDVTASGQMPFECSETPQTDLTANILRLEVQNG